MAPERAKRRLAAILAADMVGYSRLITADETGTLAQLKALRKELIDPKIAEHQGRIVKTTGDGMLIEFASVVDALQCAVEVQSSMAKRNADVPEDRRIIFRNGINLGDIVIDGGDILGDGVNVAARLEGLAEPGDICVSGTVFDHVKDKVDLSFEDLGQKELKNIAEPVQVYRVVLEPYAAGRVSSEAPARRQQWQHPALAVLGVLLLAIGGFAIWNSYRQPAVASADPAKMAYALPDKPSIAVLAFDNISSDKEQEYFSDGITEDIITDLSKISGLFVVARNSIFTYKGKPVKVRQVAEELGVRYVLEGSVRRADETIRITAQLIDALTGDHL